MKVFYKLSVFFLVVLSVMCEESNDEGDRESFNDFINSLFGGLFGNSSPDDTDKIDNQNKTDQITATVSDELVSISNTSISISENVTTSPYFAMDAKHAEVSNAPEINITTAGVLSSTQQPSKYQGQGFWASLFGGSQDESSAVPELPAKTTPKPSFSGICSANPDMKAYCQLPTVVLAYLDQNTTMEYLSRKIFNCDVVDQLQKTCARGAWCLPSKTVYNFMQQSDSFLGGSLCTPSLRSCLKTVSIDQEGCPMSKEISNMHTSLDLLCKIGSQAGLSYECFGHVMAMLHVNLADALRPDKVLSDEANPDICNLQKGLQIKHYICIRDLCTYQTPTLNSYQPWQWFLPDVASFEDTCNYEDVCGLQNQVTTSPPNTTTTTTENPATTKAKADIPEINNVAVGNGEDEPISVGVGEPVYHLENPTAKTKVLIGISSAVLIATFGLTMLICALWKRVTRHSRKRYSPSYSKLPNEEAQPLYK